MAGLLLEINGKGNKPNYTQHITSWLIQLFSLLCHSLSLLVRKQKDTLKLIHCIIVYFKCYTETNTILVRMQGPYYPLTYVHHASINARQFTDRQGGIVKAYIIPYPVIYICWHNRFDSRFKIANYTK
jgi:hypothetical protein